jgi:hypothetical protein
MEKLETAPLLAARFSVGGGGNNMWDFGLRAFRMTIDGS